MAWSHAVAADGTLVIALPLEVFPTRSASRYNITPAYGRQLPPTLIAALLAHNRAHQIRCVSADGGTILATGSLVTLPSEKRPAFALDCGTSAPSHRRTGASPLFTFRNRSKTSISVEYRGTAFRSLGEARLACFFTLLGWDYTYEPARFQFGDGVSGFEDVKSYLPDFLLVVPHVAAESTSTELYIYVEYKPGKPTLKDMRRCLALSLAPAFPKSAVMLLMHGQLHLAEKEGRADEKYDYGDVTTGLQIIRFDRGNVVPGALHLVWGANGPGFASSDFSFFPEGWNDPRLVAALAEAAAATYDAEGVRGVETHRQCADAGSGDEA